MSLASVAFRALPLWGKAAAVLGVAAVVAGAYGAWHHHVYRSGYDAAIAAVARQDQEAINAARQGRDRYRSCLTSGGLWDTTSGQCRGR
ncbi:hypothetical protein RA307_04695 [Xanthobacteraceae bacterium Astr-EGSB]|uniref:hypothetical protein n=1 Tax=Astrobacterium formosum TaxID=3069710 RepID=UPI0027B411FE|nr:hypothetical protein [Xanthobacteraceae bacterium Astr-EGSB]